MQANDWISLTLSQNPNLPNGLHVHSLFVMTCIFVSPSSCAVSEQPEWPDCKLHGDWTQVPGAGGACLYSPWEGDTAEVHDPDEAPPCGCSGTRKRKIDGVKERGWQSGWCWRVHLLRCDTICVLSFTDQLNSISKSTYFKWIPLSQCDWPQWQVSLLINRILIKRNLDNWLITQVSNVNLPPFSFLITVNWMLLHFRRSVCQKEKLEDFISVGCDGHFCYCFLLGFID